MICPALLAVAGVKALSTNDVASTLVGGGMSSGTSSLVGADSAISISTVTSSDGFGSAFFGLTDEGCFFVFPAAPAVVVVFVVVGLVVLDVCVPGLTRDVVFGESVTFRTPVADAVFFGVVVAELVVPVLRPWAGERVDVGRLVAAGLVTGDDFDVVEVGVDFVVPPEDGLFVAALVGVLVAAVFEGLDLAVVEAVLVVLGRAVEVAVGSLGFVAAVLVGG